MYINESANYVLDEQVVAGRTIYFRSGSIYGNIPTMMYTLIEDNLEKVYVYCIDDKIKPNYGSRYSAMNLTDAPYMKEDPANKIRNILLNSYPAISVKEVIVRSGIDKLEQGDVIAATQLAAWFYANGSEFNWDLENYPEIILAKQLYDWYLTLPILPASDTVAQLEIKATQEKSDVDLAFKANRLNYDGSEIIPKYTFVPNISYTDRAKDANGYYHVLAVNPPSGVEFDLNAEQRVARDGYMFYCIDGRESSQTFAAVYSGIFKLSLSKVLEFGGLKINKTDDLSMPLPGAVFNVYSGGNINGVPVFDNIVSDAAGQFLIPKVMTGFYKVVEKRPPNGYIPLDYPKSASVLENQIYEVSFNNKSVPPAELGTIKINKYNDLGNPLAGAVFNVYYGSDTSVLPSYEGLISDKKGQIVISDVAPSKYTIVETEPPQGYKPVEDKKTVDVLTGQITELFFTNSLTSPVDVGTLVIKKTDDKGLPLENAVFSVYSGSSIKNKPIYSNLVTNSNGLVTVTDIPVGEYTIVENEPPKGYLPLTYSKFTNVVVNQTSEVIFVNVLKSLLSSRQLAINNIFESVALEQAALSHILNAEGEKIQKVIKIQSIGKHEIIHVNKSVEAMLKSITLLELTLRGKLSLFNKCFCKSGSKSDSVLKSKNKK